METKCKQAGKIQTDHHYVMGTSTTTGVWIRDGSLVFFDRLTTRLGFTCDCTRPAHGLTSDARNVTTAGHRVCVNCKSVYEPEISVSGPVGSTAVLPCELTSVDTDRPYIRWKIKSETVFERVVVEAYQDEGYEGRVDVPVEELRKGNCSLVLHNLTLTDTGVYTSYQTVRRSKRSGRVRRGTVLINSVKLSVYVSPLKETDVGISAAPTVMKSPHPLVRVLSLVSCSLVQLFCGET